MAYLLTPLTNSSLYNWISYEQTLWNNVSFPPCQYVNWTTPNADEPTYNLTLPIITNASCTQVCNDSRSLFGRQDNLPTCGLWSSLVYAYNFNGSAPDPNRYIEKAPVDLLNSFGSVGLDAHDPEYFQLAVSYADVMSACFLYLYQNVKAWKSADDGLVSGACTKNGLFPYSPGSNMSNSSADVNFNHSANAVHTCLVDICSTVAMNPELAGVGFVTSFILQSFIAIMAAVVLLGPDNFHINRRPRSKKAFVAGLVSFHEAQCYFSSTVQVAALVLVRQTLKNTGAVLNSDDFSDVHNRFLDTSPLVVLATSGFIPVTFGLTTITLVGRQSWHLIVLSLVTFALATATLSTFYHYDRQYGKLDDYYSSIQNDVYIDFGTCAIGGHVGDTLFPLCGSSLMNSNAISSSTITKWWIWAAWANCMAWMLLCFFSKLMNGKPPKMIRSWLDCALTRHSWMKLLGKIIGRLHGPLLIFAVTSTLCFTVQYYLIMVFDQHYFISEVWSFGQIIAVTVWIPSFFEFIPAWIQLARDAFNEVASEPRYPSLLEIMRDIVQQTVAMANYRPMERSNYAASSGFDPEAVPLQSLSFVVDSHGTGQEAQQSEIVIEESVKPA